MKIICIGNNYKDHNKELQSFGFENKLPSEPTVFSKPDTALLVNNKPFYYPEFSQNIHYETELVIKIDKIGKYIQKEFASTYYSEIAVGIDFTARDLQQIHRAESKPWLLSKGFDNAAPISKFLPINTLKNSDEIDFSLKLNDEIVQRGNSKNMIFNFDELIVYISRFITLRIGDIIFTGTPAGVGPVKIGDKLTAYIEDMEVMKFDVR
ncbi:fumarylacetoacetate hydrolase family protein [Bacteroidales bacterium OttesenSCG-928-K03]|nr:fumarylacetoacetate hydrolase family protein [Odoribacter sp. OttesenSCG-928-L07]MDL2239493.1 fumarylacetoacetate hydrolase family protein [Bacteroidales bacterium OttesenSCG-928-L14]MDL2240449.1 fumarylacetoacetate hydrolase family protein [Bacteroidales bacterium OttesenSCG-928-K22]MDL2242961.1 fumarylacetoacetate hydrolase family protein [Bacteroidales bacterium OttesenSCG-928-K03]